MSESAGSGLAVLRTDKDKLLDHYNRTVRDDFKFRGEEAWVPYLWDMCQDTASVLGTDHCEGSHKKWLIKITGQDHEFFPKLRVGDTYAVVDDEQTDMVTSYIHARVGEEPD
jgi:hypothetical protein